jgi:hypothetical protein
MNFALTPPLSEPPPLPPRPPSGSWRCCSRSGSRAATAGKARAPPPRRPARAKGARVARAAWSRAARASSATSSSRPSAARPTARGAVRPSPWSARASTGPCAAVTAAPIRTPAGRALGWHQRGARGRVRRRAGRAGRGRLRARRLRRRAVPRARAGVHGQHLRGASRSTLATARHPCERQADGACGFTPSAELSACLASPPSL